MRLIHVPLAIAVFYLGLSISIVPAQQSPDPQGQTSFKSQQNATEEPGSHASGQSGEVLIDGKLAVPGAPADSQTVPAKFSERNARLDAMPIMALPLGLTEEQKRRIAAVVAQSNIPVAQLSAKPADVLPTTTAVAEFPADVKAEIPMTSDLHFVRTSDKILLVRAPNMVVIEEIAAN